jgi:hypothetical protein
LENFAIKSLLASHSISAYSCSICTPTSYLDSSTLGVIGGLNGDALLAALSRPTSIPLLFGRGSSPCADDGRAGDVRCGNARLSCNAKLTKGGSARSVSGETLQRNTALNASRKSGKTSASKDSPLRASMKRLTIPGSYQPRFAIRRDIRIRINRLALYL